MYHKGIFKFNNSALFSGDRTNFSKLFWQMGAHSYKEFFDMLENEEPVSLQLTKEVLHECEQLEAIVSGLQPQIKEMLMEADVLRKEEQYVKEHMADIIAHKNFTCTVKKPLIVKSKVECM